jgi:uncharacterized protein YjaZ
MQQLSELRKLAGIPFMESKSLTKSISIKSEAMAGKAAVALAKAGFTVDMEEALDVFYFNFKTDAKADEARKVLVSKKFLAMKEGKLTEAEDSNEAE